MKTTNLSVLGLISLAAFSASAQQVLTNPEVYEAIQADISPPAGALVMRAAGVRQQSIRTGKRPKMLRPKSYQLDQAGNSPAAALASSALSASRSSKAVNASVGLNLLGVGNGFPAGCVLSDDPLKNTCYFVPDAPTDVNIAVGDTQVVQWVNVSFAVFDKSTGRLLAGPIDGNLFWAGFGGRCETHNDGDIIVQWDKLAHRWIMSQPVFGLPFLSCVAVSTTPDATGSFYRYAFPALGGFPDYPKWAVQPDAYYQTHNVFGCSFCRYMGARACAYERSKMLNGASNPKQICFQTGTFDDSLLPADLDSDGTDNNDNGGGQPEVLLGSIDNFDPTNSNTIYQYLFRADFRYPKNSTFSGVNGSMPLQVDPFALACGGFGSCVPQKDVYDTLDSLGDRLMYRLAQRKFGDHQSWLVSHSVTSPTATDPDRVGERWYEFRAPNRSTNLSVYQQGTYAPDAKYRWMGSIAMDKAGNIALGYSRSSTDSYPSIYFTGRSPGDPLGKLAGEKVIVDGAGSQTDTYGRWGDYTSMAIDGADDCTFWYTNQYYGFPAPFSNPATVTASFNWSTRLASLKFSSCR